MVAIRPPDVSGLTSGAPYPENRRIVSGPDGSAGFPVLDQVTVGSAAGGIQCQFYRGLVSKERPDNCRRVGIHGIRLDTQLIRPVTGGSLPDRPYPVLHPQQVAGRVREIADPDVHGCRFQRRVGQVPPGSFLCRCRQAGAQSPGAGPGTSVSERSWCPARPR